MKDHHFGGAWTKLKLDLVDEYLSAWLKVMSNQKFDRYYIDAFAGQGKVRLRDSGELIKGSAERALADHNFDHYLFFERNRRRTIQLSALAGAHGKAANTDVRCGDANQLLRDHENLLSRPSVRGVLFLDPYGLHIEWETLEAISRTRNFDVWYLFPLSGFYRQAARSYDRLNADKEASLDRLLGTRDWRSELYAPPSQPSLFGDAADVRNADAKALEGYARVRLQSVFPVVAEPRTLYGRNDAPLFSLFFCMTNPSPKAQRVALRIASHLLSRR